MSGPSKISFSSPTPDQLHALVLDYLCHSCYSRTATAFSRDNPMKQLDADGDEIPSETSGLARSLEQAQLREEIRTEILSGRVEEAILLLNTHFPSVLAENLSMTTTPKDEDKDPKTGSDTRPLMNNLEYVSSTSTEPTHLMLNLRILAFSEACRTVPLKYPPKLGSKDRDLGTESESEVKDKPSNGQEQQMFVLLMKAQKLNALTKMLPEPDRSTYTKELENVGGLLAYKVPEQSSISKYLTMERREAVADQINRAILKRIGKPTISSLELITRYTSVLWSSANLEGIRPRPGAMLPPVRKDADVANSEDMPVPIFDLQQFLEIKQLEERRK